MKNLFFIVASLVFSLQTAYSQNYKLKLKQLHCVSQEDWTGTDQVYIKINGQTVTETARISSGEYINLENLDRYYFNSDIKVEVYEYDTDSSDDKLISSYISRGEVNEGTNRKSGSHWTASYVIYYEVLYN